MDKIKVASVDIQSIDGGSLPPYSPARSDGELDKELEKKGASSATRLVRSFTDCSSGTESDTFTPTTSLRDRSLYSWRHDKWPNIKAILFTKRQACAFLSLLVFSIVPFFVIGQLLSDGDYLFHMAFSEKVQGCGSDRQFGPMANATAEGVEALFVLDVTFGRFSFSQAKIIDAAWDLVLGRGAQLLAWTISYFVFSDAVLRLIEQHPAPFRTFMRLTVDGPSLNTAWALLVELFRTKSKRTWLLFFYMLISTIHVLSIPPFFSAMAGYDSRTVPFVNVGKHDNIMPGDDLESGWMVTKFPGLELEFSSCEANDQLTEWYSTKIMLQNICDCKAPNGDVISSAEWRMTAHETKYDRHGYFDCDYRYKGQSQIVDVLGQPTQCNGTFPITLNDTSASVYDVSYERAYCYGKEGYAFDTVYQTTRCIPDTADPSYVWGFSTMLSALFVMLQLLWGISMYALWQDAQFNSYLVRNGFRITELRAAFALTETANRETGLHAAALVRHDAKDLEEDLYGSRKRKGAEVGFDIFWNEELEVRRRRGVMEERLSR